MQIYVVKPGDTVWQISRRFGVEIQRIINVNGLQQLPYLIVGQALVIPGTETAKNYGYVEVNGYLEPRGGTSDAAIINDVGQFLTYLSPFSYQINEDGSLTAPADEAALAAAGRFGVGPLMVVTNFRNGNFDSALVHVILSNDQVQQALIRNIQSTLRIRGYFGLNIDFERIPPEDRELYNSFLRKVVAALHPLNYPVSTALAPKTYDIRTGAWHGAHDYNAHGEIVDFVVIMTYEWGWAGGPPLAVAPLNEVRRVIDYALTVIPPTKIMMGMPLYGYDWKLPYVAGGEWARRVSPQEALTLAARYGANIQYDTIAQSPFFNYTDETGIQHVVWFEDARSVQAKYFLVNEYGLRGVSYWVLGLPFPQNWAVLNDMFNIVKVTG